MSHQVGTKQHKEKDDYCERKITKMTKAESFMLP
jgi:hypothetical protein